MKKLCLAGLVILLFLTFAITALAVAEAPVIKATGVGIRVPEGETKGGLRFKMTVETPLPDGIEIVEQGTLIVPFYVIGEKELTLDTANALNVKKTENKYYSFQDSYYEFTAVLTGIPVYNFKSVICARGYITYTVDGGEPTTVYSDTVLYDIYSIAEKVMASNTENGDFKTAVDSFIIDKYDDYSKVDGGNEEGLLAITSPADGETVYPYQNQAKNYLLAGEELEGGFDLASGNYVKVSDYNKSYVYDICKGIRIKWTNEYENVASYTVMYATKSDFSDAKYAYAAPNTNKVDLYNLYKATDYYVKVIANLKDGSTRTTTSTFKTADLGPRVIHLDGSYNARDLGGYMTSSGKRTLQGLLYRSGQLDTEYWNGSTTVSTALTDYGKYTASKELGIKVDFDFRGGNYTAAFPGATRIFVGVGAYNLSTATNQENFRKAFSVLANVNNYPMIFHCQGGADRTGTVAYLLNALLGVREIDIVRDYEFTSFSVYSTRAIDSMSYIAKPDYGFFTTLNSQKGDTLQEKAESYLLSIGVTAEEIANIRSIMFTGKAARSVKLPTELSISKATELKIEINGDLADVSAVYVGGKAVEWYATAGGIAVSVKSFPASVTDGTVALKLVFNDGEAYEGTFEYDSKRTIAINSLVSKAFNLPLDITVGAVLSDITGVFIGNNEVIYRLTDTGVRVELSDMPASMTAGTTTARVVFNDGTSLETSFDYDMAEMVAIEDYMQKTTLTASNPTASSLPIGYGKWVRMRLDNTDNGTGDAQIYIGSYGVKLRGGSTRYHTYSTNGTVGLNNRPSGHNISNVTFKTGNTLYLYMKAEVHDSKFTVSLVTVDRETGEIKKSQTCTDARLTSNEYTSEQAAVTFIIGSETTELVIYGSESAVNTATFPESVSENDTEFSVAIDAKYTTVSSVLVGDTSVNFTITDDGIKVLVADLPSGLSGNVSIKILLANGEELSGSFDYVTSSVIKLADKLDFGENETIKLVKGDKVVSAQVGYGEWVKFRSNIICTSGGGDNHIYLGSYGVRIRGGFRIQTYNSNGTVAEVSRTPGLNTVANMFNNTNYIYMKVEEISDTQVRLWFKVEKAETGKLHVEEEYYTVNRIANEIPSENACVTFMVGSSATAVDEITLYKN